MATTSLLWAVLAGCAVSLPFASAIAAEEVQCPPTLATTQTATQTPVHPWEAVQQGESSRLLYSDVYAGPWRDEQPMMVDRITDSPGRETLIWRLRGNPSPDGTWLVCTYQNTQLKLLRRLPESITECVQVNSSDPKRVIKLLEQRCR